VSAGLAAGYRLVSTGYAPRPLQAELHLKVRRFNVVVCHRRFGKTVWAINHLLAKALKNPLKRPQYAYLAPTWGQAKRVAWEYLKEYAGKIPGATSNEADLRVDIPRPTKENPDDFVRIMLLGAENPMALKGLYLDGTILDEYGEMNPVAWREVIRPTLSDRTGWAIFLGTPKGRNHFWELYTNAQNDPEWFAAMFKSSQTGIIPQFELESAKKTLSEEEFEQEFECSFQAGLVGAYWSKEIAAAEKEGRITAVPHDPALSVETFWDLGMNDVTSIWFVQKHGMRYQIIRYMEAPDTSIPEWVRKIRELKYNITATYLPHDAQARDLSTGKSREEMFRSLIGNSVRIVPRNDKLDAIQAARVVFSRCWFDRENCSVGIKALMEYQRRWDEKTKQFSPKPLHNSASNGADAFQQFALGVRDDQGEDTRHRPRTADHDYDVFAT
jgi:hypothetical protein